MSHRQLDLCTYMEFRKGCIWVRDIIWGITAVAQLLREGSRVRKTGVGSLRNTVTKAWAKEESSTWTTEAAAAAKSLQSCPTLWDPVNGSPPGSPVPGILQGKNTGWVAISFSSAWKWKVKGKSLSHVRLIATPWTAAHQALPSMGFSRQEYRSGVPVPSLK